MPAVGALAGHSFVSILAVLRPVPLGYDGPGFRFSSSEGFMFLEEFNESDTSIFDESVAVPASAARRAA